LKAFELRGLTIPQFSIKFREKIIILCPVTPDFGEGGSEQIRAGAHKENMPRGVFFIFANSVP
jgi:hypothetical protein